MTGSSRWAPANTTSRTSRRHPARARRLHGSRARASRRSRSARLRQGAAALSRVGLAVRAPALHQMRCPRSTTSRACRPPSPSSSGPAAEHAQLVGTVTTLSNLLRMLYSRAGTYPRGQVPTWLAAVTVGALFGLDAWLTPSLRGPGRASSETYLGAGAPSSAATCSYLSWRTRCTISSRSSSSPV